MTNPELAGDCVRATEANTAAHIRRVAGTAHKPRWNLHGRVRQAWVVCFVYIVAFVMTSMDGAIVNTALPTMSRGLHMGGSEGQWVVVGYLLSLAACMPASGWLSDRFGSKRVLVTAVAAFTAASLLCAASTTAGELVAARVLQGAAGGMLTPVGAAMLFREYPGPRRARIQPMLSLVTLLSPASAPLFGGLIVSGLSWHWIFLVNLPVGLLAVLTGGALLRKERGEKAGQFDWIGFVSGGGGLALLLLAVSEGPLWGWRNVWIVTSGIAGLCALALFVRTETRVSVPMLRITLLKDRTYLKWLLVVVLGAGAFQGALFLIPQYLQLDAGYDVLRSGFTTFPDALGVMVASQVVRRIYGRLDARAITFTGLVVLAASATTFGIEGATVPQWGAALVIFGVGIGVGTSIAGQLSAFYRIDGKDMAHSTAIWEALRKLAPAVSVSIVSTTIVLVAGSSTLGSREGFKVGFGICAAFALVAALIALIPIAQGGADEDG